MKLSPRNCSTFSRRCISIVQHRTLSTKKYIFSVCSTLWANGVYRGEEWGTFIALITTKPLALWLPLSIIRLKLKVKFNLKQMRILLENCVILNIIRNIQITKNTHLNVYDLFYSPKYITNIEVYFVGYSYIMDLMHGSWNILQY